MKTTVKLGAFESTRRVQPERLASDRNGTLLGFQVQALPPQFARRMRIDAGAPVVTEIDPFGPAGNGTESGLNPGHVIRKLNGKDIRTLGDLRRASAALRPGDLVSLVVMNVRDVPPVPTIVNYRIH
jgi:S1-C subfamily serine protease